MLFRSKLRAKNDASKRRGGGEERKVSFLPLPLPPLLFFASRFISRAVKTKNLVPRSFFAPKQHGNACYAGYELMDFVSLDTQYYSERPLCMTHKKLKSPIQLREVDDHGIA